MAFTHGKDTRVLVNEIAASSKLHSVQASSSRSYGGATAYGDSGEKFIPGLLTGTVNLEGNFEDNTLQSEFQAADGVDNALLVSAAMAGFTVGNPVLIAYGDQSARSFNSSVSDTVGFTVEEQADEMVDFGRSLHDLTAKTATGNGTAVDNAASSASGGVAALHVTAVSGTTPSNTVKVQHSVDNSVWVDLITFTAATAATSQRSTVSGTVNRYTRETHTITGTSPSFTFAVAFARR